MRSVPEEAQLARLSLAPASPDEMSAALDALHASENRIKRARLRAVVEYDRSEAWRQDGVCSMVDWLTYRHGKSRPQAAEEVRVAWALEELPAVAAAYEEGLLSDEKVAQLTTFLTPDDDAEWAERAQLHSFNQIEHMARFRRRMTRRDAERSFRRRYLRLRVDEADGALRLTGRLPAADGAVVRKALERIVEQAPPNPDGTFGPAESRNADALVELSSMRLAADSDADRATVVVHVEADALNHVHGTAELDDGTPIPSETARRLACDARLQLAVDGSGGEPIGLGRTARTVPPWLLRQLRRRDRGCRFADCGRTRGVQAHHAIHWAHGGRTDLDNLVLVCPYHHRQLHEGGFRMVIDGRGHLRAVRPDGRPVRAGPTPLRAELRERLFEPLRSAASVPA